MSLSLTVSGAVKIVVASVSADVIVEVVSLVSGFGGELDLRIKNQITPAMTRATPMREPMTMPTMAPVESDFLATVTLSFVPLLGDVVGSIVLDEEVFLQTFVGQTSDNVK